MARVEAGGRLAFVGRGAELGVVRDALEAATSGRQRMVVVEGEAGIGKSHLLAEALAGATAQGCLVLFGRCEEMEQDRPLQALRDALQRNRQSHDGDAGELDRLLRAGHATAGRPGAMTVLADLGWVIVEAVVDLLERLAAANVVALAVEDLQWADPLTLRAVHAIGRQTTGLPLALIVTVRDGARHPDVNRVVAALLARGAHHVVLAPLGRDDTVELAREVAGDQPGPRLIEQLRGTGGNPLFVIELVRALGDHGALEVRDGLVEAREASLPPTLRLTLLRRLSLLPESTLNLLRVASILGSTFSVAELTIVTCSTTASVLSALTVVVDAGLVVESGDRLAFRHDLVRDAIYQDLPSAVRRTLHREVASALAAAGAPVDQVASHIALGSDPGDVEAIAWLRRAATSTSVRSPETAVRLLERALDLVDSADPVRDVVASELVVPLLACGRMSDAETLAHDVLARGPEREIALRVHSDLAGVLSVGARYSEAIRHIEQAAASCSEEHLPSLIASKSLLMVFSGRVPEAREAAREAVAAGERLGDDYARCVGLQTLGILALAAGFVDDAIVLTARSVEAEERAGPVYAGLGAPHLWYGTALSDADRFAEAEVAFGAGRRLTEHTGNLTRLPYYHWGIAEMRLAAGRWDDAVADAKAGLELIEDTVSHVGDVFANALCAHVAFHRSEPEVAQAAIAEAHRRLVAGPVEIGYEWMSWIEALLLESRGETSRALSVLARTWDEVAPLRYLQATSRAMGPDLVRLALANGDRQRALMVTEELEGAAARGPTQTGRGIALRCRGLLDDSAETLIEAVAAHRIGPRPYQLAAACEDAAVALWRTAHPDDAVSLLNEAADIYEQLDAVRDLTRVQAVLPMLGTRPRRATPRRPTFGWESLTPSERRVVALVAGGLTNGQIGERLFVSRRTVATHLEHVFVKLGHANRVELAAEAARRAAIDPLPPGAPTRP